MNTHIAPRPNEQRSNILQLQLRYRDGRFEVFNQTSNEIDGHLLLKITGSIETYMFITRSPYSKHSGTTIRQALSAVYGKDFYYTIESIL
jgi:hypothetical protein